MKTIINNLTHNHIAIFCTVYNCARFIGDNSMNFIEIAKECLTKMNHKTVGIKTEPNIVIASFGAFDIGIFYSKFEYEVGFSFSCCNQSVQGGLSFALSAAGCPQGNLPEFLFMSDEQIMQDYIMAYLVLVDEYYNTLNDTALIQQRIKNIK